MVIREKFLALPSVLRASLQRALEHWALSFMASVLEKTGALGWDLRSSLDALHYSRGPEGPETEEFGCLKIPRSQTVLWLHTQDIPQKPGGSLALYTGHT